jgi:NADH:ubiquinone oxidoreductase subunit
MIARWTEPAGCGYIAPMASIGTRLFTMINGHRVGEDSDGNVYYQAKKTAAGQRQRRWVLYKGEVEASRIPPDWHAWIHHLTDTPLTDMPHWAWQKPHQPNLTGTALSYRPSGHDYSGGARAAATGDYEAWTPGS